MYFFAFTSCFILGRSSSVTFKIVDDVADILLDDSILDTAHEAIADALDVAGSERFASTKTSQIV